MIETCIQCGKSMQVHVDEFRDHVVECQPSEFNDKLSERVIMLSYSFCLLAIAIKIYIANSKCVFNDRGGECLSFTACVVNVI